MREKKLASLQTEYDQMVKDSETVTLTNLGESDEAQVCWICFFKKCCSENPDLCSSLTHSNPVFYLYTPWKRQKTKGFLTFSGGLEMEHWIDARHLNLNKDTVSETQMFTQQCSVFTPLENVRKPKVFLRFQGVWKLFNFKIVLMIFLKYRQNPLKVHAEEIVLATFKKILLKNELLNCCFRSRYFSWSFRMAAVVFIEPKFVRLPLHNLLINIHVFADRFLSAKVGNKRVYLYL